MGHEFGEVEVTFIPPLFRTATVSSHHPAIDMLSIGLTGYVFVPDNQREDFFFSRQKYFF